MRKCLWFVKKLTEQSDKNSPKEYNRIYLKRSLNLDSQDWRRWNKLLKYYKGGSLIDLGCLDSLIPMIACGMGMDADIWGIDLAEGAIEDMAKRYPYANFRVRDVYKTGFPAHHFDYAVAGEILEHLEFPEMFLKESFRILRPGGTLALSVPYNEAVEPGAVDGDRHLWSFDKKDLKRLLSPYGKVKFKVLGSEFFPYKYHFPTLIAYATKR